MNRIMTLPVAACEAIAPGVTGPRESSPLLRRLSTLALEVVMINDGSGGDRALTRGDI